LEAEENISTQIMNGWKRRCMTNSLSKNFLLLWKFCFYFYTYKNRKANSANDTNDRANLTNSLDIDRKMSKFDSILDHGDLVFIIKIPRQTQEDCTNSESNCKNIISRRIYVESIHQQLNFIKY
jgi:hypothetical protein